MTKPTNPFHFDFTDYLLLSGWGIFLGARLLIPILIFLLVFVSSLQYSDVWLQIVTGALLAVGYEDVKTVIKKHHAEVTEIFTWVRVFRD